MQRNVRAMSKGTNSYFLSARLNGLQRAPRVRRAINQYDENIDALR